jgi:N-acetylmuramoyl-L-alanine amidase
MKFAKLALPKTLAVLSATLLATLTPLSMVKAQALFGQQEVTQSNFMAIASPGGRAYSLLILEQIPGARPCWSENGATPTLINPLLLTYDDFSRDCRRATDSNAYSIRIDGQDYGADYLLRIMERGGELVLLATHRRDRNQPEIVVGRTRGMSASSNDFLKIFLDPGWRFTRRTFEGNLLGHTYLTGDSSAMGAPPDITPGVATPTPTGSFGDIANDIYRTEIQQAVEMGFIAGFKEDNTFRPLEALTREQIVSMVIEALSKVQGSNVVVPNFTSSRPYPDVEASRWSEAKIKWAKDNNIVSGYPDGNFRPRQAVTRAELMAILKRSAEYANTQRGLSAQLTPKVTATSFADIASHWAQGQITEMSAYCRVASAVNEQGNRFEPNSPSRRNYAAAATLRMLNCVKGES